MSELMQVNKRKLNCIEDPEELLKIYIKKRWEEPQSSLISSDYPSLYYKCGCSENHALRDTLYTHVAPLINFIFYCENGFMTAVKIKGVIRLRPIVLWTCSLEVFVVMIQRISEILDSINNGQEEQLF